MDAVTPILDLPTLAMLQAFAQSNLAGKAIVFLLLIFSLLAWTVMVGKYMELAKFRDQNRSFQKRLDATERILLIDPALRAHGRPLAMSRTPSSGRSRGPCSVMRAG
jgi:biopolymer transport protein ExbB/TolQ